MKPTIRTGRVRLRDDFGHLTGELGERQHWIVIGGECWPMKHGTTGPAKPLHRVEFDND